MRNKWTAKKIGLLLLILGVLMLVAGIMTALAVGGIAVAVLIISSIFLNSLGIMFLRR